MRQNSIVWMVEFRFNKEHQWIADRVFMTRQEARNNVILQKEQLSKFKDVWVFRIRKYQRI